MLAGCGGGVNDKMLDDAQARIEALKSKGLPDDQVSGARVYLYQAREYHEKKNGSAAKKAADSMKVNLEKAEAFYQQEVATLGPKIDAAKAAAFKAKEELSGYQARKIDSLAGIVDSFRKMDWLLQANIKAQDLVARLPALKEDEAKARKLRGIIPGEWVFEDRAKSVEDKNVNALTRKVFNFGRDGKVYLVESKKGQSGPYFKEDWEFRSYGTYGCMGDTIVLAISRFHIVKQLFTKAQKDGEKIIWKDEPGPTYDSTITDRSQDRTITYDDLKVDFKKVK
jgi:hypothetical protein